MLEIVKIIVPLLIHLIEVIEKLLINRILLNFIGTLKTAYQREMMKMMKILPHLIMDHRVYSIKKELIQLLKIINALLMTCHHLPIIEHL